jgi:hypothetical protein
MVLTTKREGRQSLKMTNMLTRERTRVNGGDERRLTARETGW